MSKIKLEEIPLLNPLVFAQRLQDTCKNCYYYSGFHPYVNPIGRTCIIAPVGTCYFDTLFKSVYSLLDQERLDTIVEMLSSPDRENHLLAAEILKSIRSNNVPVTLKNQIKNETKSESDR